MARILLLGGTSEASALARALAERGDDAIFSYAGRTSAPIKQPLPTRVGGFGGVDGLADYIRTESITCVVDATHPFAKHMSRNAIAACAESNTPLIAFERPPWTPQSGDNWTSVADLPSAAKALPKAAARVFLAIGKQTLDVFSTRPEHHYLLRLVDGPVSPLPLPNTEVVIDRGPFNTKGDLTLLSEHRIDIVVAKNAGGAGASAKLEAARNLGLPVIMVDRPALPERAVFAHLEEVLSQLDHLACRGV